MGSGAARIRTGSPAMPQPWPQMSGFQWVSSWERQSLNRWLNITEDLILPWHFTMPRAEAVHPVVPLPYNPLVLLCPAHLEEHEIEPFVNYIWVTLMWPFSSITGCFSPGPNSAQNKWLMAWTKHGLVLWSVNCPECLSFYWIFRYNYAFSFESSNFSGEIIKQYFFSFCSVRSCYQLPSSRHQISHVRILGAAGIDNQPIHSPT